MGEHEYRYVFEDAAKQNETIKPSPSSPMSESPSETPEGESSFVGDSVQAFVKRGTESTIQRTIVSPLNTVTGGMASPLYGLGRAIFAGGGAGAIGGAVAGLAVAGVQLAMTKVQERVSRLENQAATANERDNALIRGGSKTTPTFYEANFFRGVTKTSRN